MRFFIARRTFCASCGYYFVGGLPQHRNAVLRNDINIPAIKRRALIIFPKTAENFDEITGFLTGSCEGAYASQIFLLTKQTNFNTFVCLLLVCSFSPKVQKYLLGSPSPIKRREFDGFLGFFAGSENPSVLSVHEFSGSVKTPKRRELSPF